MDGIGWLTAIVAVGGVIITVGQLHLARIQLDTALLDRRYKVFDETRIYMEKILQNPEVSSADFNSFFLTRVEAEFLFNAEVNEYLEKISQVSSGYWITMRSAQRSSEAPGDMAADYLEQLAALRVDLIDAFRDSISLVDRPLVFTRKWFGWVIMSENHRWFRRRDV